MSEFTHRKWSTEEKRVYFCGLQSWYYYSKMESVNWCVHAIHASVLSKANFFYTCDTLKRRGTRDKTDHTGEKGDRRACLENRHYCCTARENEKGKTGLKIIHIQKCPQYTALAHFYTCKSLKSQKNKWHRRSSSSRRVMHKIETCTHAFISRVKKRMCIDANRFTTKSNKCTPSISLSFSLVFYVLSFTPPHEQWWWCCWTNNQEHAHNFYISPEHTCIPRKV